MGDKSSNQACPTFIKRFGIYPNRKKSGLAKGTKKDLICLGQKVFK